MLFKILLWGVCGAVAYMWFRKKLGLDQTEDKTTIHHHHYGDKEKPAAKKNDDDYIDYEELK